VPYILAASDPEFVWLAPETRVQNGVLTLDLYFTRPAYWTQAEEAFMSPVIRVQVGEESIQIPLGYRLISPQDLQVDDHLTMRINLPPSLLRSDASTLHLTGELVELEGITYGRHQSFVHNTTWVETFLDKTLPIE
jgi:hypothetical protein